MKIRVTGEMTLAEIRQALWEMIQQLETTYGVRYSRGATLFINPTNGFGDDVSPRGPGGETLSDLRSNGPYKSAADEYKI